MRSAATVDRLHPVYREGNVFIIFTRAGHRRDRNQSIVSYNTADGYKNGTFYEQGMNKLSFRFLHIGIYLYEKTG